jgi:LPXTG-motif cell wall-anchored protein
LVTPEAQSQLTAPAGEVRMLVDGVLVDVSVVQASAELRLSVPGERSAAQVAELRDVAAAMVSTLRDLLGPGGVLPISVRETATGAVIVGLLTDPVSGAVVEVPVEHVVLVSGGGLVLMVSGADGTEPAQIGADGVLEISEGGVVSVLAYGLAPGAEGEVVVMSVPRLISEFAVGADGGVSAQAQLPNDLGVGHHTVVVTIGADAASLGFRIVGVDPRSASDGDRGLGSGTLPQTGSDIDVGAWAVLMLALGALLSLIVTRRRPVPLS